MGSEIVPIYNAYELHHVMGHDPAKYGVSFGSALAIVISYNANHSILWAIIHGILGWFYVIYFALFWL